MSGPQAPAGAPESPSGGRGRRPGGPDTRGQILEAARGSLRGPGFAGNLRPCGGPRTAGVDPALVHHYFGSKDDLFLAALEIPVDPRTVIADRLRRRDRRRGGAAAAGVPLGLGRPGDPAPAARAGPRTALGEAGPASLLREGHVPDGVRPGECRAPGRATPSAGPSWSPRQLIGLVVGRYLLRLEPLASMPTEELVALGGAEPAALPRRPAALSVVAAGVDGAGLRGHNSTHDE